MSDTLTVLLDDAVAGSVTRLQGGRLRFDYDDEYRTDAGHTPLSVSMPTSVRSHADAAISPWLWGLLPDNPLVLERWSRQLHAAVKPFSLLSTPIGHDCAGAVRFAATEEALQALGAPGSVTWLTEADIAARLRELRDDNTAWLGREFTGQFSLAGAQAKTALLYDDGRWGEPSGAAATSHILKPAVAGLDDHDLNEHLCLDAAGRAGLVVARTHVERFADESAIVVDRYDRRVRDGQLTRIHQEDVCQALGLHPDRKYQRDGGPGPADVANLLRNVMAPLAADDAVWSFFDALVWNWLVAGTDAHAKNYSLLLSGGDVRLAPLYDIASVLPYDIHERKARFAMKIGGDYRVYPERNTWDKAAQELGLDVDRALDRVVALANAAPDAFADAARTPEVVALDRPLPARLVDLVTDRVKRCLAIMPSEVKSRAKRAAKYSRVLDEILDATPATAVSAVAGPDLIRDAAAGLTAAVATTPRDLSLVREQMVQLGATALGVIRAIGEQEAPAGFVNPTSARLAALIADYAPNIANLQIPTDDRVARVADEITKTANRYVRADTKSLYGTPAERLRLLYRIVGLAALALAL
jgi:serine/threonine-protein kinase HipA